VTPGAPARTAARIVGAALLIAAAAIVVWEPWHGPVVVTLSSTHGIDAGDGIVIPLVVLSAIVWKAAARPTAGHTWSLSSSFWRWSGPVAAIVLGVLLILAATVNAGYAGALLPAGGGTFGSRVHFAAADESLPVDRWTYVALTYDGSVLKLFVNGRVVASRDVSERLQRSSRPLWIGGNHPYGEHFDGVIDELRIYSRALTRAELEVDRASPAGALPERAAMPPGLVSAYSFDAGSGGVVEDVSGHGHGGEVLGAKWTSDGRFGNALQFDGSNAVVRVAPSPALDMGTAMTLSAWVKPASGQSGWRTVVQRETDAYFLDASSAGPDHLGRFDDPLAAGIVVAALWFGLSLASSGGGWLGRRRRQSWAIAVAVAAIGLTVDMLLAPAASALALAAVALWLAASATGALEVLMFTLVAVVSAAATWTSLDNVELSGIRLGADDGGAARAGLLGLLLLVIGLLRAPAAMRSVGASRPTAGACRSPTGRPCEFDELR
jgi:hypothetical protein